MRNLALTGAAPPPHTEAELERLLTMVRRDLRNGTTVSIGHSRHANSVAAADAFAAAWRARGFQVSAVVDWPEDAASWLRQARRLTAGAPDAWVVAGGVAGFVQLSRRLVHSTDWTARRTFAFGSLTDSRCAVLAGARVLDGLRGATRDGNGWAVRGGEVVLGAG
ncbi:ABC transporter substrate-binding protein [Nocardia sp. CS682]|uniref:ABC transporter substrate-binding protein n=1 Tax=Nocardia sp. CS682 TaxID=1047172 RepID=UPI0019814C2D|nr:ABC transporter substrate-binding protein [Nocardia sp. CS682]